MKVFAPGKLILSGEHSVVYGKPALAMAVNRYACAEVLDHGSSYLSLDFANLSYKHDITFDALDNLKNNIKNKYDHFKQGHFNIRDVLQNPFELAQFALGLCLEMINIKLSKGMKIYLSSTIPMGCGMGSSAATILSIIHAMANHAGINIPSEKIYELGLQAENMQHGTSSGLDLYVSLYGGCCYVKDKIFLKKAMPTMPAFLVNTGIPQTSTGECVMRVAHHFKQSSIGDDFEKVTEAMVAALHHHSLAEFKSAIAANHDLLTKIGVVPEQVRGFIKAVNALGGAAKICGAGAVSGNTAGIVMAVVEDEFLLTSLCQKYNYEVLPVNGEARGVYVDV